MNEKIKVLIEVSEPPSRVLFFSSEMTGARNIDYEVACRIIFVFGESVANMLVFGSVHDDGHLQPSAINVQVAGMTAVDPNDGASLVTYGLELITAYVNAIEPGTFDGVDDPLTIADLSVDLPDDIA